jgi:hypothetical protein
MQEILNVLWNTWENMSPCFQIVCFPWPLDPWDYRMLN